MKKSGSFESKVKSKRILSFVCTKSSGAVGEAERGTDNAAG